MPLVSTVAKKPMVISEASKMQLYGKGAFALGKKFKDGKLLVETFSRFNNLNVLVARERYPQTSSERLTLQIRILLLARRRRVSNNDANVIFSSEVRFEDNTNDGWQSGCYDKAFASFKTDFVRGGDSKGNQRSSLRLSPKQKTTLRKLRHGHRQSSRSEQVSKITARSIHRFCSICHVRYTNGYRSLIKPPQSPPFFAATAAPNNFPISNGTPVSAYINAKPPNMYANVLKRSRKTP